MSLAGDEHPVQVTHVPGITRLKYITSRDDSEYVNHSALTS